MLFCLHSSLSSYYPQTFMIFLWILTVPEGHRPRLWNSLDLHLRAAHKAEDPSWEYHREGFKAGPKGSTTEQNWSLASEYFVRSTGLQHRKDFYHVFTDFKKCVPQALARSLNGHHKKIQHGHQCQPDQSDWTPLHAWKGYKYCLHQLLH